MESQQFSVDGVAVKIGSTGGSPARFWIHTTQTIYVNGASTVTSGNGFKMDNGDQFEILVADNQELWAIGGGGTAATVYVMKGVV